MYFSSSYKCNDSVNDTKDNRLDKIRNILQKDETANEAHEVLAPDIGCIPEIESASMGKSNHSAPPALNHADRKTPPAIAASSAAKNGTSGRSPNIPASRNFASLSVAINRISENTEPEEGDLWKSRIKVRYSYCHLISSSMEKYLPASKMLIVQEEFKIETNCFLKHKKYAMLF